MSPLQWFSGFTSTGFGLDAGNQFLGNSYDTHSQAKDQEVHPSSQKYLGGQTRTPDAGFTGIVKSEVTLRLQNLVLPLLWCVI